MKQTQGADLEDIRASIARNCAAFAADPKASASAADVIITLRRTATAVQSVVENYAGDYDVTMSEVIILMALAAAPAHALAQAAIARQLAVTLGRLTPLVVSLERAGLLERTPAEDRRVTNVALTRKGTAFVRRFAPVHYRNEAEAMSVLSAADRRTLLSLLDKLRGAVTGTA